MKRFFLAAVVLLLAVQAEAEVKLPALLGSNMVLQRNTEVNFWGVLDETLGTVNIRMPGYMPASAMASTAPSTGWNMNPLTGISMLDCPEQTHTSPSITLSSTTSLPSLTVTV